MYLDGLIVTYCWTTYRTMAVCRDRYGYRNCILVANIKTAERRDELSRYGLVVYLTRLSQGSVDSNSDSNSTHHVDMGYCHSHSACTQQEAGISNGSVRIGQAVTGSRLCSHVGGKLRSVQHIRESFDYSRPATLHARSSIGSLVLAPLPPPLGHSVITYCCALSIASSRAPSYSSTLHSTSLSPSPQLRLLLLSPACKLQPAYSPSPPAATSLTADLYRSPSRSPVPPNQLSRPHGTPFDHRLACRRRVGM